MVLDTSHRFISSSQLLLQAISGFLQLLQVISVVATGSSCHRYQWFSAVATGFQQFSTVPTGCQWFSTGYQWFLAVPIGY